MTAMTNYLEDKLVKHVFMSVAYTDPTNVYMGLYTLLPTDLGTDGTEVTGGSYARQVITFAAGADLGTVSNSVALAITNMPACTVVGLGIFDAVTAGNCLVYGPLATTRTLVAGETLTLDIDNLTVSFQ